jgi:methyltransferase (TIGR00027 family)
MRTATGQMLGNDFQADYRDRINPSLINSLAHQAVPVLQYSGWNLTTIEYGFCESELPLQPSTTNQHGTHQAALISLSADYTGGMALTTVLTGVPLAGIHPPDKDRSASLWLASMNVRYLNPSTGHLLGKCRISDELIQKIRRRYMAGKKILVNLVVEFESNGQRVAEAEMKYFCQSTKSLLESSKKQRLSSLANQKLKSSARMIAGVRATGESKYIRVDCPHAASAAGPQGKILADKLRQALPQLPDMVLARTKHIDETILSESKVEQIVLVGAGLDMRPYRLKDHFPSVEFFELDLPEMLDERERVLVDSKLSDVNRHAVPANFLTQDLCEVLTSYPEFDRSKPTAFIYEGCSMYFTNEKNRELLTQLSSATANPDSYLWSDFVTTEAIENSSGRAEVTAFLKRMDALGESFIFGVDDPGEYLQNCGWGSTRFVSSREYLNAEDPIFNVYQFCIGRKG